MAGDPDWSGGGDKGKGISQWAWESAAVTADGLYSLGALRSHTGCLWALLDSQDLPLGAGSSALQAPDQG